MHFQNDFFPFLVRKIRPNALIFIFSRVILMEQVTQAAITF